MSRSEHPISLTVIANQAFQESMYWSTVGVVNLVLEPKGSLNDGRSVYTENVGTASAVQWRNNKMLLTAKHVIEGAGHDQLAFLLRPGPEIGHPVPLVSAMTVRRPLPIKKIIECSWEDLAIILFDAENISDRISFIKLNDDAQAPETGTMVAAIGYPADSAVTVGKEMCGAGENRLMGVTPLAIDSEIIDPGKDAAYLSGFEAERHILLEFSPHQMGRKPHGFSGAGFWFYKQPRQEIWYSQPRLAGVCTNQYEESGLLRGVRAELVVQFVKEALQS